EVAILDLRLESFPSGLADFRRAAVRAGAKEDVPLIAADADLGGRGPQLFVYFGHGDAPVFSVILSSVTRSRMVRRYLWIIAGRGVSNGLLSQTFRRFRDKFRRMLRRLLRTGDYGGNDRNEQDGGDHPERDEYRVSVFNAHCVQVRL